MEVALKMLNQIGNVIGGIIAFLISSFLWYQYTDTQKFRKEVSENYVRKDDFVRFAQDNKEDHRKLEDAQGKIYDRVDEVKTLIIQKVR